MPVFDLIDLSHLASISADASSLPRLHDGSDIPVTTTFSETELTNLSTRQCSLKLPCMIILKLCLKIAVFASAKDAYF
jgi:hypothetical protein